ERAALPATAFVEGLDRALALAERHPNVTLVTREREMVRGPIVRVAGSAAEAAGVFALQREQNALARRLEDARRAQSETERRVEELKSARLSAETGLPALRDSEREARAAQSAFAGRLEERLAERDRLRRESATLAEEERVLRADASGLSVQ